MSRLLNMNASDKLCFLLSNDNICIAVARALYDILEKEDSFYMSLKLLILLCGICWFFL